MNSNPEAIHARVNGYEKILNKVVDVCAFISGIALTIMMLITAADVILRLPFIGTSIIGAYEMVEFLMGITVPFALCYCEKHREHISVDLIMQKFPVGFRRVTDLVTSILVLALYITIAIMCWKNVYSVYEDQLTSSVLLLQVWPYTIPSALGFTILFLQCINHIGKVFKTIVRGEGEVI